MSNVTTRHRLQLAGLFLLFAIPTALWLYLNRAPPNWDDSWYLANSLASYDSWHTGGIIGMARAFLVSLGYRAPLIVALPAPFYWILGRHWQVAFFVNGVAMALMFVSVYQIGKRLRTKQAGLIAVYIAGTMPLLYGLARWYLVEYSLTSLVAAAFCLILLVSESGSFVAAAALGFVCGLGMLIKADFPLFVLPSFVYLFLRSRINKAHLLLLIAVPCLVLAAPWYVAHWRATWEHAFESGFGAMAAIYGTGSILTYLKSVTAQGISFYYIALGLIVLIVLILQRRFDVFRRIAPLGLWLLPFWIFMLGDNQDVRLMAPILPAFALSIASLLEAATERWKWLVPVALIFPFLSFLAVSFGWPYSAQDTAYAIRYDPAIWGQDDILRAITTDLTYRNGEKKMILLATDRGHFNVENFQLAAVHRQLPLRFETTAYSASLDNALEQSKEAAYIVYKQGGEPESPHFNKFGADLVVRLRESSEWETHPFSYHVPDGGTAHILRRR